MRVLIRCIYTSERIASEPRVRAVLFTKEGDWLGMAEANVISGATRQKMVAQAILHRANHIVHDISAVEWRMAW